MIAFRSLRQTALVWITILLALVGLATLVISYRLAKDQAAEFLDGQLRQVALNVGMGLPDAAETPGLDQDPEERLAVAIWNADGSIARTSPTDVNIPRQSRAGFAYLTAMGRRWRVYTANHGARTVQVAQHMEVRDEIARGAALGAAAPVLILIPLSWLVVSWSINHTLGRLNTFARDIAARGASAAAPIPLAAIPTEVVPVVNSMNGLIERLRSALDTQKRFLADAAHELRTPLAAMQIEVEGLSSATTESLAERKNALSRGMRRASALVDQLLRLARLDEPARSASENVDIAQLLLDCVGDHVVIADRKGVDLGVDAPAEATLPGNREAARAILEPYRKRGSIYACRRHSRCQPQGLGLAGRRRGARYGMWTSTGGGSARIRSVLSRGPGNRRERSRPCHRATYRRAQRPCPDSPKSLRWPQRSAGPSRTAAWRTARRRPSLAHSLLIQAPDGLFGKQRPVFARASGEIMMNVKQNMEPRYGLWASISVIGALLSLVPAFAYTGEELISEARAIALKAHPGKITDEELERESGGTGLRYSFDVKNGGVTQEVGVDAITGRVLENAREGKNPD
jgi:two-component system, OmpR family, sensor kinase